jgi:hypothetical protein
MNMYVCAVTAQLNLFFMICTDPKLWIAQHNLYSVLSEVSQTDQILVNKSAKDLLQSVQGFVLPPQKPPQQQQQQLHHPHHQT